MIIAAIASVVALAAASFPNKGSSRKQRGPEQKETNKCDGIHRVSSFLLCRSNETETHKPHTEHADYYVATLLNYS